MVFVVKSFSEIFVLCHQCLLQDELSYFILLTVLHGCLVFPSKYGITMRTVNIANGVTARDQISVLLFSNANIYNIIKQVGFSVTTLKCFGDDFVMIGEVCVAHRAQVYSCSNEVSVVKLTHAEKQQHRYGGSAR